MSHPNFFDVVFRIRNQFRDEELLSPNDSKPCNPFKVTQRVAWELRNEGVGLIKKGGNNCNGYSTDAVMFRDDGEVFDCLVASGETNKPAWNKAGFRPFSDWAPPIKPDNVPDIPPVDDLAKRVEKLETTVRNHGDLIASMKRDIAQLADSLAELKNRKIPTGVTSSGRIFGTVKIPIDSKLTYD